MSSLRGIVLLAGMLACLVAFELSLGVCTQEDAFISFRYARNLVDGHGLVYNPGERVEGYTNFLWVLATAGAMKLGLDPVPFSRWLGLLLSVALVLLVWRLARARDRGRGVTGGLVAAAVVAFSPPIAVEAVQGLETVAFAFLVTAGAALAISARETEDLDPGRSSPRPRLLAAALVLWLAALTRPEGVGVFALTGLGIVLWRARDRRPLVTRADWPAAALFVALYLAYWIWRFRYYGEPLPNTFYAKTGGGWWHVLRGLGYVGTFLALDPILTLLTLWLCVPAARHGPGAAAAAPRPRDGATPLLTLGGAVIVVGYLMYVVIVGGDFKKTFRFVIPVLPLWALLLDDAISRRGWPTLGAARTGRLGRVLPAIVLGALLLNAAAALPKTLGWARERGWDLRRRTACGRWLGAQARPGALLAIHSAGIIPYYSGLPTVDMWGLNDRHIAHEKFPDMGRSGRWIGHEKEDAPYAFSRNPTYYVDEALFVTSAPVPDLRGRIFADPGSWGVAARYVDRSAPVEIDSGHGVQRYWFNFLESRPPSPPATPERTPR